MYNLILSRRKEKMADKKISVGKQSTSPAKKMEKGDSYLCEICGLQVNIDVCGEFLESKGPSCCGKPMKQKAKA
jgi:hypothetical protein